MANGVASPVVPLANDIIMGEFIAYINYGLPTQLLLGATDGGCKVSIDKKPKQVKFDGAYGYTLDSNGVPLVRNDTVDVNITLKSLYLKFNHVKKISDMESDGNWESGDWSATGGTYAAETSTVLEGDQSAKLTADTQDYGMKEVFDSAKDLTAFANGETSGTGDYIGFAVYISTANLSAMGSNTRLKISLHKDADETETNYYYYNIASSALTADQWNVFKIAKSAFSEAGTASWSAVTGVSVKFGTAAPTSETVVYIDSMWLIHNQDVSSIVPVNGHGFTYTNETTYREYRPNLAIEEDDYIQNVTLVGQKLDGKKTKIIMENCLNDGKISKALQEKTEVVDDTMFSGHYKRSAGSTIPLYIREYVA